jgi:hypothetical protein
VPAGAVLNASGMKPSSMYGRTPLARYASTMASTMRQS